MRIEQLGSGEPEVAIVGGIHGDEPCGVHAVETLVEAAPAVQRPVALVVANEAALERGERYVERDLNRAFPGDHEAATHEGRLAARLRDAVGDCATLSLHSTRSYEHPFAIARGVDDWVREVVGGLPVDALVEAGAFDAGRVFESIPQTVEVECGFQGSASAAENAVTLSRAFLAVTGAIDGAAPTPDSDREVPVFHLERAVPKGEAASYEVYATNFERVAAGETFAASDEAPVVASEEFYPVLMSADGYEELFGYAASLGGNLR